MGQIKLKILSIIFLISLISYGNAFCSMNEYQNLYYDVKKLYDSSEYNKCIDKSLKIIKGQEKLLLETKNYVLLANLYELQADCLERKGDTAEAIEVIQDFLEKMEQFLPEEHVARVKLKIGHIYKHAGLYSKALSAFETVEKEYKQSFPDRFAKYANENYREIASHQVATISGTVSLSGEKDSSGVTIKVFNGFEESETMTLQNGKYSMPLFSSTPGTMFSLFAYKQGYNPTIINKKFERSSEIEIEKINLKKIPDKDVGIVAGVVFTPISGGKIKPHHGIARYLKEYKIEFSKLSIKALNEIFSTLSNDSGIYIISLAPGLYLFNNEKEIRVNKKEVRIFNIGKANILVD